MHCLEFLAYQITNRLILNIQNYVSRGLHRPVTFFWVGFGKCITVFFFPKCYTFYSWAFLFFFTQSFKWKPHCVRWSHFLLFFLYLVCCQVNTICFKSFLWLNVDRVFMLQNFNWAAIQALTASDLASYTSSGLKTSEKDCCVVCNCKDWTLWYLIQNLIFTLQAQWKVNGNGCTLCIASTYLQQAYHLLNILLRIALSLISPHYFVKSASKLLTLWAY